MIDDGRFHDLALQLLYHPCERQAATFVLSVEVGIDGLAKVFGGEHGG